MMISKSVPSGALFHYYCVQFFPLGYLFEGGEYYLVDGRRVEVFAGGCKRGVGGVLVKKKGSLIGVKEAARVYELYRDGIRTRDLATPTLPDP